MKIMVGATLMLLAGILFLLGFINSYYLTLNHTIGFYILGIILGATGSVLWALGVKNEEA